jgi:hypothetical protein
MPRKVAVVAHTHWDREWYEPYQSFRMRLVAMMDELLPHLESDPGYTTFMLDGQMAAVDDYLEVRPAAEERLRLLAGSGRITMGPWYILMDEFGVSGETIVRNLQLGLERAAAFGGPMGVGYLPDMFGHIAQMPQLLRLAGFDHAVVWRGVPSAVDKTAFWWSSPDGSTVRTEYLRVGYSNGADTPQDAKGLLRRIRAHESELGSFLLGPEAPMLWMNGTDHQSPQWWMPRVAAEVNGMQDDVELVLSSLPGYLSDAPVLGLPRWAGELRSGARANLLMGVASNRVDVKQAAARAERALERQAEPLSALFQPAEDWPGSLLSIAWREMIRNSAHDSICACSVDEVGAAVLHRYGEAEAIATGVRRQAVRAAGRSLAHPGPVAVNPSHRTRGGVVEITVAGEEEFEGSQVLQSVPASTIDLEGTGADIATVLAGVADAGAATGGPVHSLELTSCDDGIELTLRTGRGLPPAGEAQSVMAEVWAQAGARPALPVRVHIEQSPWKRLAVHVDDVPGFGWAAIAAGPMRPAPVELVEEGAAGVLGFDNGLLRMVVDQADGTFTLNGVGGLDRLVDDGDAGDTYNYSPPAGDVVIDRPDHVAPEVIERGPVRGRMRVTRRFRWPERLDGQKRQGTRDVEVVTLLEVRAGEDIVRVTTSLRNECRDHRLRAWFPLATPASTSRAECAFAIVERGLVAEGGPHEHGLATFPSRRFVTSGGVTVLHEGLLEYELVDIDPGPPPRARSLALTLLRATGFLSRNTMAYRPNPAGPSTPLEGPQLQTELTLRYAVHVGEGKPYELCDQAWIPLEVARGSGRGDRPARGSELTVSGAEVSSLRRVGGNLELRLFNPLGQTVEVAVEGWSGWVVDLRGAPIEPFESSFVLGPSALATVLLTSDRLG